MKKEFNELADYNTRVFKGIVHTKEYKKKMEKLQKEFNEIIKLENERKTKTNRPNK